MKKLLIFAFLLVLFPFTANAHSGLSTSTPSEGEALTEAPTEVLFQFDSPIQQGDMSISEANGNAVEFSDISAADKELRGEFSEGLPNGTYTVEWNVISEDSHEVTGTLTFNVAAEAVEEEAVEEETVEEENTSEAVEAETDEAAAAVDQAEADTPWVTILIIALLLIAAVTFFIVARRK